MTGPVKKDKGLLTNPLSFMEKIKEKRKDEDYLLFATIVKKLRNEKNLTIYNLSKDICSISYLSKLENGLIETNETTINLLFDRLGVNYESFKNQNKKIDLKRLIKAYSDNNIDVLYNAYVEVKECPLNINKPLINGLYYLATDNLKLVETEIKELEPVKETLGQFEAMVFLFIVIEYYVKSYLFNVAYEYLKLSEMLVVDDGYLKLLVIEDKLVTAYHLNNYVLFYNSYKDYLLSIIPTYSLKRKLEISFLYQVVNMNEYPTKVLDSLNAIDIDEYSDDVKEVIIYYKYLVKSMLLPAKQVYDEMIESIDQFNNGRLLGLLASVVFLVDTKECYEYLYKLMNNYDYKDIHFIHQKYVCFVLMYGSRVSDHDLLEFFKSEIMVTSYKEKYHLYDETYKKVYLSLLASFSRYKEAYLYLLDEKKRPFSFNNLNI